MLTRFQRWFRSNVVATKSHCVACPQNRLEMIHLFRSYSGRRCSRIRPFFNVHQFFKSVKKLESFSFKARKARNGRNDESPPWNNCWKKVEEVEASFFFQDPNDRWSRSTYWEDPLLIRTVPATELTVTQKQRKVKHFGLIL